MRKYTPMSSSAVEKLLNALVDKGASPAVYGDAMRQLGQHLAEQVVLSVPRVKDRSVCIVCTVEDADFLARGLLEGLEAVSANREQIKLICFWNDRVRHFNNSSENVFDIAPIIKEYREPVDVRSAVVIVVKSIISGACVVKTNLATLIDEALPEEIVVAAPVMYEGAESRLASQFPASTSARFKYFTFAVDNQKAANGEDVLPGIGGSVYTRLGFEDKTAYVPDIVKQRRQRFAHA
jgi:hypothetical protein